MSERDIRYEEIFDQGRDWVLPGSRLADPVKEGEPPVPRTSCGYAISDALRGTPEPDPRPYYVREGPVDVTHDGHLVGSVDDLLEALERHDDRTVELNIDVIRGHVDSCKPCQLREAGRAGRN